MARFRLILKWVGIVTGSLIGLFVLLIVLVGVFGSDSNEGARSSQVVSPTVTRKSGTTPVPTATPIMVTAGALEREQEANEVYWEDKYLDKHTLITGYISAITEAGSRYDVKLHTDNPWVNIVCKVSSTNKQSVLELATGDAITVYGLITNDGLIDIVVSDCLVNPAKYIQTTEEIQSPVATPVPIASERATPTATPALFDQYQGMEMIAAYLTVHIRTSTGSGSGFLYRLNDTGDFMILTNAHVLQGHSSVEVCWALVQRCVYEKVKEIGAEYFDVAVVEFTQFPERVIDAETLQWFTSWYGKNIAKSEGNDRLKWAKGDVVYAAGYPGGHKIQGKDIISDPIVTEGIIATDGLASYQDAYFIEHGAYGAPGVSGGPLMNSSANVIGINTGGNLLRERLVLAIPMTKVIEWLRTGEEPNLTRLPQRVPTATPGVTSIQHPTQIHTPEAEPWPTQAPKTGSRGNPIPFNSSVSYPDWSVVVTGFVPDANAFVASENAFNDPPDSGYVYILVEVKGTYTGTSVGDMRRDLNYYVVGNSNVIYEPAVLSYDGLQMHPDVLAGGTAAGSVIFIAPSNDVSSLLLIISDRSLRSTDATIGYFSLN